MNRGILLKGPKIKDSVITIREKIGIAERIRKGIYYMAVCACNKISKKELNFCFYTPPNASIFLFFYGKLCKGNIIQINLF